MSNFEEFIAGLTPDQIQKLKQALNNNETNTIELVFEKKPETKQQENSKSNTTEVFTTVKQEQRRKEQVKFRKNTWQDNGEDRYNDDLKTPKFEPTPRNREKSKKIEVECHVCGKTFFEDPRYIYGEYLRCSKCGRR